MAKKTPPPATRKTPPATPAAPRGRAVKGGQTAKPHEAHEATAAPLSDYPDLADVLPELAEEYRACHEAEKKAKERKEELAALILPLLDAVGAKSVTDGDKWTVVKSRGANVSIKKERLLEKGVSVDIITYATVKTPYEYVQVIDPKRK